MLIGIISDSHDHIPNLKKAVKIFKDRNVELVLHAGDYCSPFMIHHFEGLNLKGIFGNNDGDKYLLISKFRDIGAELAGDFLKVEEDGLTIAVYHGTYAEITSSLIESGRYDVVITGHTHEMVYEKVGETIVINPGTANGFDGKDSIAFLDTETREVEFVELD
ncbi:metallophosphoesterase [Gracilimonas sp.]|uniref:metallophosphoesterase n=1 Tax=Gracilimonas sp. TaxID=1974203 RepID=UPI0032ED9682